jgi:hypothetical protein
MLSDYRRNAPGSGISGWNPGFSIQSIVVNNPTGSWLTIKSSGLLANAYIPPYTIGWTRNLYPASQVIDVLASGPTGSLSSIAGDPYEVVVYEGSIGADSVGITYNIVGNPTPLNAVNSAYQADSAAATLIPASPGKRIRLYSASININQFITDPANFSAPVETVIWIQLGANTGANTIFIWQCTLSSIYPTVNTTWPIGLDCRVGDKLLISANTLWPTAVGGPSTVAFSVTYQII